MSVSATAEMKDQLYVPFRTDRRGGRGVEPVGTVSIDVGATGAAGGGTVFVALNSRRQEFGFHPLYVLTYLASEDNLTAAEVVQARYSNAGNERMIAAMNQNVLAIAGSTLNVAFFESFGMVIDPNSEAAQGQEIISLFWDTNTDTKIYHLHAFMYVYDGEIIAREGGIGGVLGGIT